MAASRFIKRVIPLIPRAIMGMWEFEYWRGFVIAVYQQRRR